MLKLKIITKDSVEFCIYLMDIAFQAQHLIWSSTCANIWFLFCIFYVLVLFLSFEYYCYLFSFILDVLDGGFKLIIEIISSFY